MKKKKIKTFKNLIKERKKRKLKETIHLTLPIMKVLKYLLSLLQSQILNPYNLSARHRRGLTNLAQRHRFVTGRMLIKMKS
jgi:hypothetical protein